MRKAQMLQLDGCQILKTIQFGCEELVELNIRACPELEELTIFRGPNCQEKIIIDGCGKLKCLQVDDYQNLKSVLGISNLAKLLELEICGCGKQEFDHLCLSDMKCLERMTFDRYVEVKYFEFDCCQNLKTIEFGYEELVELSIQGCPELVRVPVLTGPSCLEKIITDGCEKLKYLQLDGCQNFKTIQFGCEELVELNIRGCPELEELTVFRGPNCLERIIIEGCGNLKCLQVDGYQNLKSVLEISNLAKLVELEICGCRKQEFDHLSLSGVKFLERMTIDRYVKVKYVELDGCQNLKTIQVDCEEFVELSIRGCPELEELPAFRGMDSLERIIIEGCGKLKCLQVDGYKKLKTIQFGCEELVELIIRGCPELEELTVFRGPNCLEKTIIDGCGKLKCLQVDGYQNLKSVLGISNLAKLVELEICGCGKQEFDHLSLSGMKCLERIKFDRLVQLKYFEFDGCQNLKAMQFDCEELVELRIRGCPELEELPVLRGPSCLERIIIDRCGKLQCLQVNGCQNLKSLSGNFELRQLHVINCPELEEVMVLMGLDRLSCFGSIKIHNCEKLQNISGIEEWQALSYMSLCYCSNALLRNCIRKLEKVSPYSPIVLIGRVVDGAESTLNQLSFSEFEATALTSVDRTKLGPFIVCFAIVVDRSFSHIFQVRPGEWIITMVVDNHFGRIENLLRKYEILKGGFCLKLKEDEELNVVHVLRAIVDKLYHS
ncbi:F-box/LRR-repeat protein 15-like [Cryptomeria japonica]|uniref:F-box/LRR-repeat protein 15-like n=1 Tax=Cryptomeria japonica TaxID=3369 RepID=UPI0027DA4089|nr:F-box/LRR-repeat protein 15-like [Cryptomeria japonica]